MVQWFHQNRRFSAPAGYRTGVQKADQRTGTAGPAPEGAG